MTIIPLDWKSVRDAWETGRGTAEELARTFGTTAAAIHAKRRGERWAPKSWRSVGARSTITRLKKLIQRRLAEFEAAPISDLPKETDIKAISALVSSLHKLLDLEFKERVARQRFQMYRRYFTPLGREGLARKLEEIYGTEEAAVAPAEASGQIGPPG